MTTVLRLKRSLSEEPVDTFIVNCKRLKTESDECSNELLSIYQRATTSQIKDQNIVKHLKNFTKGKIEQNYKIHISDFYNKIKIQNQEAKKNIRYKVVNLHRAVETDDIATSSEEKDVTVVDIEEDKQDIVKEEDDYVYDLYYSDSDNLPEIDIKELVCVYPLSDDLIYDNEYENEVDTEDSDSNDENNWRNDYPDESDVESVTEEDMINAMRRLDVNEENELSSDNEDLEYVYDDGNDSGEYGNDADADGLNRYEQMYASMKEKLSKLRKGDNESDNSVSDNGEHASNY